MDTVYYHDIFLIVKNNQKEFCKFSEGVFEAIKEIKKTQNNNLKLEINTSKFSNVNLKLKSGRLISLIGMIKDCTGYSDDKDIYSLLWYMFTDLEKIDTLFRKKTISDPKNQWISIPIGVVYGYDSSFFSDNNQNSSNQQIRNVLKIVFGPLPNYYSMYYKRPDFLLLKSWRYTYDDSGNYLKYEQISDLEDKLNISDFYSILSPGYHRFVAKETNSDLKIPSIIKNEMDLKVLFSWINKNRVTAKNIRRVLCHGTSTKNIYKRKIIRYIEKLYPKSTRYSWFNEHKKTIL